MLRLLMIADDFTGALDTGVQLAAHGIPTQVVVGQADLSACSSTVLVVDTETRHLSAAKAAEAVARLTRSAVENGVGCIYKKTDSALRGNIGAELAALLKASGARNLPFLPAFPQIGRTTKKGVHYIDGVPVNESPFGIDPFEPVRCAEVTKLIHLQTDMPAQNLRPGETASDKTGILVYDAATAADLEAAGRQLFQNGTPPVLAGCAGFAAFLPELLGLSDGSVVEVPQLDPRLLVLCGSVNPITLRQMDTAEKAGFTRLRLTPRQKLEPGYWASADGKAALAEIEAMLAANPRCIIETNDGRGNQLTADRAARGIDLDGLRVGISGTRRADVRGAVRQRTSGYAAAHRRRHPAAVHEQRGRTGAGTGVRTGKRHRAGAVRLSGAHPLRYYQVRRLWAGGSAGGAGRPHCKALKMEADSPLRLEQKINVTEGERP